MEQAGERIDRALAAARPELSRSAVTRLVKAGLVLVNGRRVAPSYPVRAGDMITVTLPDLPAPLPAAAAPGPEPFRVVFEDEHLLVIDKPSGLVVHPAPGHPEGTLVNLLLARGGTWSTLGGVARPGIVHRLDRGTSGLMVVARDDRTHRALATQLTSREMAREYLAVVRGRPPLTSGVLDGPVGRHPTDRQRMAVVENGRVAITRFSVLETRRGYSLVRCRLETGRTHQIRVHLSAYGYPVAGDERYAGHRAGEPDRPMLHAERLRFIHPVTGGALAFEAPPPADFRTFWDGLA